jgi:hypothetical protein
MVVMVSTLVKFLSAHGRTAVALSGHSKSTLLEWTAGCAIAALLVSSEDIS